MTQHHLLFTGGGTLGPVTPLLAVADEWRRRYPESRMTWVGTPNGPERELLEGARYDFFPLHAPKFDRTRIWKVPFVLPGLLFSLVRSFLLLRRLSPDAVVSAGAYVSVPIAWVAWVLRIPVWTHQLDVQPGLANRLIAPVAKKITVTWAESARSFPHRKTEVVGAMARKTLFYGDANIARQRYHLVSKKPTVLVIGGGTGAQSVNEALAVCGEELVQHANVLHLTGAGKSDPRLAAIGEGYVPIEFLSEGMADAYAVADLVVARAGMGTLAELVALKKPSIIIPMPHSHQEKNAQALLDRDAAEVMFTLTPQTLLQRIEKLLRDHARQQALSLQIGAVFPLQGDRAMVDSIAAVLCPTAGAVEKEKT